MAMVRQSVRLLQVRGHCTFTCSEHASGWLVEVGGHCEGCVEEVRRRGYVLLYLRPSDDVVGSRPRLRSSLDELSC